jgi:drug/metabolite transporter (DMT)-like permease
VRARESTQVQGLMAAFLTPLFLGVAPIFGKLAITAGAAPFGVAAVRTAAAVLLLWGVYLLLFRRFIYIYPAGLLGCVVIGAVNGIGSLFYYGGLGLLDASLTQLLNGMYLVFAVMLTRIGGQRLDRRTLVRVGLALAALVLLTGFGSEKVDWLGVGLMLGSAIMFAGTVILSQYVLLEMPSPTMTLYSLSTMAVLVLMVWLAVGAPGQAAAFGPALAPILLLGVTTALSRLAMYSGIKILGSMQTAILAIAEIGVALVLAFLVLGERLTGVQVVGVGLLAASLLLVRARDLTAAHLNPGALLVQNMAAQQFQFIAFHRAFGRDGLDHENDVMAKVTTREMRAIQRMMGADGGPLNPFPIANPTAQYSVDLRAFLDETQPPDEQPPTA